MLNWLIGERISDKGRLSSAGLGAVFLGAAVTVAASVQAQQVPGLIVSVPTENESGTQSVPSTGRTSPTQRGTSTASTAPTRRPSTTARPQQKTNARRIQKPRRRAVSSSSRRKHSVAILVNDEPITHHEINQRARLLSMNGGQTAQRAKANFKALIKRKSTSNRLRAILEETIQENRGRPRDEILAIFERRKQAFAKSLQRRAVSSARRAAIPAQRTRARNELIEERLKLQEAKRLNVVASDAQIESTIANVAKRNKISSKRFLANIARSGVDPATFKERLKAQISWAGVVRRKFGRQISVNMADVDRYAKSLGSADGVTLRLQKITLGLPQALGQAALASRLRDAELLRQKFSGCQSTAVLARSVTGAKFQDLGRVKAGSVSEPTRSLLIQAKDGEMLPPQTRREGVVLYAVCGRNAGAAKDKARSELQQREFQIMGQRHLADLKRDAHIEYR